MGAANISKGSKYSTGVGTNSPYQSCYPPQHFDLVWPVFLLREMLSQGCMNEVLCNYIPSFPTRYRSTVQSLKWVCFMTSYWVRLIRHTFTVLQGTCVPTTIRAGRKIKVWFSSILFAIVFFCHLQDSYRFWGQLWLGPWDLDPPARVLWSNSFSPHPSRPSRWIFDSQQTTHGKPPQNRKFLGK